VNTKHTITPVLQALFAAALVAVGISPVGAQEQREEGHIDVPATASTEAQERPQGTQTSDAAEGEPPIGVPGLAEIVPLATELSGRLATLKNEIAGVLDVSALETKYAKIDQDLKGPAGQLQRLKDSKNYRVNRLVELAKELEQANTLFEATGKPLSKAIQRCETWRKEWLTEKSRVTQWQSSLLKEPAPDQIKLTFAKANDTIDTALNLVLLRLESMLAVQQKAAGTQEKVYALAADVEALLSAMRHRVVLDSSPPMLSSAYFSQFSSELWSEMRHGVYEISWPSSRFFARTGWIVLFQGLLSLVVIVAVYRHRQILKDSESWRFLAARPLSAGFFLSTMATILLYEYQGVPATWELAYTLVGAISFARLSAGAIGAAWKKHFVYGLAIVLIVTRLMYVISLPLPVFRLYTILVAVAGLLVCVRWSRQSRRYKESAFYSWSLRLGAFFFLAIIIAELWGKTGLAENLLVSSIDSLLVVLSFILFMRVIRGGLEWAFDHSPLRRMVSLPSHVNTFVRQATLFIDFLIWAGAILPAILLIWGLYDSFREAIHGLWTLGFALGSQRISVGIVMVSVAIMYGAFLTSWIIQELLIEKVLVRRHAERGVRQSIARLVHYFIILVAFLVVLSTLGLEITKLTIVLSALGVGIGFGLQSVVNNFISGLLLLFERPIRVGDTIELGGNWAEITRIGLRATTVRTLDDADVIIPNADLITNQVTNWTLTNRRVRCIVPVGVAYGSDVSLVMETLKACAMENSKVAKAPTPSVLFRSFGASSLDFELRAWVMDADDRLQAISELNQEIDRRFREAGIEIAFPQQDLHLRSLDDSVLGQIGNVGSRFQGGRSVQKEDSD